MFDFDPRDYSDARDPRDACDRDERDRDDARWPDRERDTRERGTDPRDVFTHGLNPHS